MFANAHNLHIERDSSLKQYTTIVLSSAENKVMYYIYSAARCPNDDNGDGDGDDDDERAL